MQAQLSGAAAAATVSAPGINRRRALVSTGLLLAFLTATGVARLTGHFDSHPTETTANDPVSSGLTWLATHDYRLIAQLRGSREVNVTAVRRGDVLRGDVQTMDSDEERSTGYYRFRIRADHIVTTTGALADARWRPASPSQRTLLEDLTDPRSIFSRFQSRGEVRYAGQDGDARIYRDRQDDQLVMIDERPVQAVLHGPGDRIRAYKISPAGASTN